MNWYFFFNDTATTEIYTLSLHDALPIYATSRGPRGASHSRMRRCGTCCRSWPAGTTWTDRKSTRLNSSHSQISYAVFCLKKKNNNHLHRQHTTLMHASHEQDSTHHHKLY